MSRLRCFKDSRMFMALKQDEHQVHEGDVRLRRSSFGVRLGAAGTGVPPRVRAIYLKPQVGGYRLSPAIAEEMRRDPELKEIVH